MAITYDIYTSEFFITEEDFKDIKDDDNSIFYANTDLEKERILNQKPVGQFASFDDAYAKLKNVYKDEVWFAKEGFYKVLMYWIEENDGFGTDEVERNKKFNVVIPKPEFSTDEVVEYLKAMVEESQEYIEHTPDKFEIQEVVAVNSAINIIQQYANNEV